MLGTAPHRSPTQVWEGWTATFYSGGVLRIPPASPTPSPFVASAASLRHISAEASSASLLDRRLDMAAKRFTLLGVR